MLDIGCGTGEHVLMAAALDLDATGIDLSGAAIHVAKRKARQRWLTARFLAHDARSLGTLGELFDTVLDRGLLVHAIDDDAESPRTCTGCVQSPGARHFMLCFHARASHHRDVFADGWRVDVVEPAMPDGATSPDGIPAWLVALTRTAGGQP